LDAAVGEQPVCSPGPQDGFRWHCRGATCVLPRTRAVLERKAGGYKFRPYRVDFDAAVGEQPVCSPGPRDGFRWHCRGVRPFGADVLPWTLEMTSTLIHPAASALAPWPAAPPARSCPFRISPGPRRRPLPSARISSECNQRPPCWLPSPR